MRHPLLRILLALLIGLVSPMCCCFAAVVAGMACSLAVGEPENDREGRSCCGSCCDDEGASTPTPAESGEHDKDCPSCTSCGGEAAAVNSAPIIKFEPSAVTELTAILAAIAPQCDLGVPISRDVAGTMHDARGAAAHTGRDAQRWHCARIL